MDVQKLIKIGKLRKVASEEYVFHQNDEGDDMFLILQGSAGVYATNVDGSRVQLAELSVGQFFGEMALVDKQPRSADVQAAENLTLFVITEDNFEKVIETFPDLAVKMMRGMSIRIRTLNTQYGELWTTAKGMEKEQVALAVDKMEKTEAEQTEQPSCETDKSNTNEPIKPKKSGEKVDYETAVAPAADFQFLMMSKVNCPVCEDTFETLKIRTTLLKQKAENKDFRIIYDGFEPYWYRIWVCPHCTYANFDYDFQKVHYMKKKGILKSKSQNKIKYSLDYKPGMPKTLHQVLSEFLLCQEIHEIVPLERLSYAKSWLYLLWIYTDADDQEMIKYATDKALDAYIDFYMNGMAELAQGQEIRLCMLIAELNKNKGCYTDAVKYLYKAVQMRTEPERLREMASDRLMEYKDLR